MNEVLNLKQLGAKKYEWILKNTTFDPRVCPTCSNKREYVNNGITYKCNCEEQILLQKHFFAANIGSLYHIISYEDLFDEDRLDDLQEFIVEYVNNFDDNLYYGRGITFWGPLGTGKSFAACIVLKELIKRGYDGYFIMFDDLLNLQQRGWDEGDYNDLFYEIRGTQVLVIDELIAKPNSTKATEYLAETLERIIRFRVSNRLPTIITTNLTPEKEREVYPRVSSLLSTSQVRYTLEGEDERQGRVRRTTDKKIKAGERRPIR